MNLNKLPIGTIVISNNVRLMIVGYSKNQQNNYIVCVCNENELLTGKLYTLSANQIDNVLSLGYVDINTNVVNIKNNSDVKNQNINASNSKFIFDANGYVIAER